MTENHKAGNYAIREQFNKLNIKPKRHVPAAHTRALTSWRGDGIDHINVSSRGKTKLGNFLAHDGMYPVVSPKFGKFATVRNLWLWLKTENRDDRLRDRVGRSATALYSSLRHREVKNFRAIILDTDWQKLKQYPDAAEVLKTSTHPLDMYFYPDETEGGIPRRPNTFHWLVEGWEELRQALREGREPDLTPYLDIPGSGIYDFAFSDDGSLPAIMEKPSLPKRVRRFTGNAPRQHAPRNSIDAVKNSVIDLTQATASIDATKDELLKDQVHVTILEPVNEVQETTQEPQTLAILPEGATVSEIAVVETSGEDLKDVITASIDTSIPESEQTALGAALAGAVKS